jgi:hypothetical protein
LQKKKKKKKTLFFSLIFLKDFYNTPFFFGRRGVLTQGLVLGRQVLYHLSHTHNSLYFIFQIVSGFYAQASLDHNSTYTSHTAGTKDVHYHAPLFIG